MGDEKKEPWLKGINLQDAFPTLFQHCTRKNLTVAQALENNRWIRHLKANLSAQATREFLKLWEEIQNIHLTQEPDRVQWKWTANGVYTARSAYKIQFEGCTRPSWAAFLWKSDAPGKCKLFAWLALLGRCNTANVLARKGWPHNPSCSLCNGPMEDVVHLLASCPVSIRIWHDIIARCNLHPGLAPSTTTTSLVLWIEQSNGIITASAKKPWSALVQLVWWSIWNERNARIFRKPTIAADDCGGTDD